MHARAVGAVGSAVAAVVTVLVAITGVSASASTLTKPYTLVITNSPGSPPPNQIPEGVSMNPACTDNPAAGDAAPFVAVLTNQSNPQPIGSANINIANPTGFVLTDACITGTLPSPTAVATLVGQTVELRGLAMPPGVSVTVAIAGFAPCAAETNSSWTSIVKQSNDFSGAPGNDFAPDQSPPQTFGTTGSCSLTFTHPNGEQPAQAIAGVPITNKDFTPIGTNAATAVEVGVLDAASPPQLITDPRSPASKTPISVALGRGAGGTVVLSGTVNVNASRGIARFGDLSVNQPSVSGYTLVASVAVALFPKPQATGVESSVFQIWQAEAPCTTNKCTVTANDPSGHGNSSFNGSPPNSTTIEVSISVQNFACDTNPLIHAPFGTTVVTGTNLGSLSATVTINKNAVTAPASQYQVCYEDPNATFVDVTGASVHLGLLPGCKTVSFVAPCIVSISKDKMGNVVESLLVTFGDPYFR